MLCDSVSGNWLGGEELMEGNFCVARLVFVLIGQLLGGRKRGSWNWGSCEETERLQGKTGEEQKRT